MRPGANAAARSQGGAGQTPRRRGAHDPSGYVRRTSRMDFLQAMASCLSSPRLIALQVLAQKSPAAMNAALARFAGDAQALGRLADGELLHVAQQDHFAV